MLRLTRPQRSPEILQTKGHLKTQELCDLFDQSAPHRTGAQSFPIDDTYRDVSVRKALERAQHHKCCYCESKAPPLEVEHHRPKSAVQQTRDDAVERPGYYWLAYEWTNLMLACVHCNQPRVGSDGTPTGKGMLFPLADPTKRARSHHDSLAQEEPLLLNPYEDNPDEHIGYREHIPYPLTSRGEATIEVLKLRGKSQLARPPATWKQVQERLELLGSLADIVGGNEESQDQLLALQQECIEQLWTMADETAEYAAMVRAGLTAWGLPPEP